MAIGIFRDNITGPTRYHKIAVDENSGLSTAELVSRGWLLGEILQWLKKQQPQVVILCEDKAQYYFIKISLELKGFHRFIPVISPYARGSGEQFVRSKYPVELKEYAGRKTI